MIQLMSHVCLLAVAWRFCVVLGVGSFDIRETQMCRIVDQIEQNCRASIKGTIETPGICHMKTCPIEGGEMKYDRK